MIDKVCMFPIKLKHPDSFHILNFVYETKGKTEVSYKTISSFRMCFITEGIGKFYSPSGTHDLSTGDIVLIPPAVSVAIQNVDHLKYIYISYIGVKANYVAEQFKVNYNGEVYHGYQTLDSIWESIFSVPSEVATFRCESVLLYTFSEIGKMKFNDSPEKSIHSIAEDVKKLIDDNFSNSELSLDFLSDKLSYHPKYLSTSFKKEFKISITDYIRTLRIQHACALMEQGFTLLKDIATLCGFKDSLYFSKVFKEQMGLSPKEHIKTLYPHSNSVDIESDI